MLRKLINVKDTQNGTLKNNIVRNWAKDIYRHFTEDSS